MYAGPYGGNGLDCCSDNPSAAFKNYVFLPRSKRLDAGQDLRVLQPVADDDMHRVR